MSLKDKIADAKKRYGGSGTSGWFKFKEGKNRLRILAEPTVLPQHFANGKLLGVCYGEDEGCPFHQDKKSSPSVKWLTWVIDYADGEVKLAALPWSVARELTGLEESEEYPFTGWPMPYDVIVTAKNAGTSDVDYSVLPARKETPVAEFAVALMEKNQSPEAVVEAMKDKSRREQAGKTDQAVPADPDYPDGPHPDGF